MRLSESIKLLEDMREQLEMIISEEFKELGSGIEFLEAKYQVHGVFCLECRDLIVEHMDQIEMFEDMRRSCETVIRCYQDREEAAADEE